MDTIRSDLSPVQELCNMCDQFYIALRQQICCGQGPKEISNELLGSIVRKSEGLQEDCHAIGTLVIRRSDGVTVGFGVSSQDALSSVLESNDTTLRAIDLYTFSIPQSVLAYLRSNASVDVAR